MAITGFDKWLQGGTYEIPFEFGVNAITSLAPKCVFSGFQVINCSKNVYNFPKAPDMKADRSYQVAEALDLKKRTGSFDDVHLTNIIKISNIYEVFEIGSTNVDYFETELKLAFRAQAEAFEDQTITDLIAGGTKLADVTLTEENVFQTINKIRTQMVKTGSSVDSIDLYVTPEVLEVLVLDKRFMIASAQAADEVRNGFRGKVNGMTVYESARINGVSTAVDTQIIAVDRTRVVLLKKDVRSLAYEKAPSNYMDSIILKALGYFKHYIAEKSSVLYLNKAAA